MIKIEGLAEAERIARANMSPRFCRLTELEKWANGTQYKGRPNWWDDSVPLWEREPCIVYPIVQIAVQSNVDLVLGESRAPKFTAHPGEDEDETDGGIDEESSKALDRYLSKYHQLARFRSHCREAFVAAQQTGTAVAIHGVRNGVPFAELVPAAWCIPTFSDFPEVVELEIRYPFIEERKRKDGKWEAVCKLYRRVLTAESDTEYFPAEANEYGTEPAWKVNEAKTIKHGLGFCPVVWYPFMVGARAYNVVDGDAIHKWITDDIQAHDIARSQWHRGALLSEPQLYEIGVTPGYNPTDTGVIARIPVTEHGGPLAGGAATPQTGPVRGYIQIGKTEGARKKGPGYVWQYQGTKQDVEVDVLNYPGDALKAQQDNCSDLRIKIQEALAVVFLDPENIKFAATTSGKALEAIKQKQIDRCGQYRDDLRDRFLLPSVAMQLRITRTFANGALRVPGLRKALPVVEKLSDQIQAVDVVWGDWFDTDPTEQKTIVEMVKAALKDDPIVTKRIAVEKIAPIFGIENVEAAIEALEEERAERQAEADAQAEREARVFHAAANGSRGAGRDQKPASGGGSRGNAAPPSPGA